MSRIEEFLREDIGYGDITTNALIGDQPGARIHHRQVRTAWWPVWRRRERRSSCLV